MPEAIAVANETVDGLNMIIQYMLSKSVMSESEMLYVLRNYTKAYGHGLDRL